MEYNPFSPQVKDDPYPYYSYLRDHRPVSQVQPFGFWAVTRYEDVCAVLKSPELFSSTAMGMIARTNSDRPMASNLIASDPPEHTRLRNVVSRAFTPRMVAELEPRIREFALQLIHESDLDAPVDIMAALATPLPVMVIAEILGVEKERRHDFKRWSDQVVAIMSGTLAEEDKELVRGDMEAFTSYFSAAIERRRKEPGDDLISILVRAEAEDQTLAPEEVLSFTALLLIAGNETTTNLIGNAVVELLDHPDQLELVAGRPELIPNLVEESLRYDSPVQGLFRRATRDVPLGGEVIPEGAMVMPLYASANRDDRRFVDPDRFDVTRDTRGHIAFGLGIHFCLGAPLARLEARVVLEELLPRLLRLQRGDETIDWVDSFLLRGPKALELVPVGAAASAA